MKDARVKTDGRLEDWETEIEAWYKLFPSRNVAFKLDGRCIIPVFIEGTMERVETIRKLYLSNDDENHLLAEKILG